MTELERFLPLRRRMRFGMPALFDDWFRAGGMQPFLRESELAPDIRADVSEDDKTFRIKAEIPGVHKDDIDISVQGNQLSISAEVKRESESTDADEIVAERLYGRAWCSFTLPTDVDGERTEARYAKGILNLVLPKQANGNGHRIAVN